MTFQTVSDDAEIFVEIPVNFFRPLCKISSSVEGYFSKNGRAQTKTLHASLYLMCRVVFCGWWVQIETLQ
jgi:hypothetical protein